MATELLAVVAFPALAPAASLSLPHGLNLQGVGTVPDFSSVVGASNIAITATATDVTATNNGAVASPAFSVLVWRLHSSIRSLAGLNLAPQPFPLGGSGGAGASPTPAISFVFRAGGVAGGNVYTTWPTLMAARDMVRGDVLIQVDDSIAPCMTTPGIWNTDLVQLWGAFKTPVTLTVVEGTIFTKLRYISNNLYVIWTGTTPPVADFDPTLGGIDLFILAFGSHLDNTATGPFFDDSSTTGIGAIVLHEGGTILPGTSQPISISAAGAALVVIGALAGELNDNCVTGVVGSVFGALIQSSSAFVSKVQPAMAGFVFFSNNTRARLNPTSTIVGNTLVSSNDVARVDATGAPTITLPLAFNTDGQWIIVKEVGGSANVITIVPSGADTIDGAAMATIAAARGVLRFVSDGVSDWMIV